MFPNCDKKCNGGQIIYLRGINFMSHARKDELVKLTYLRASWGPSPENLREIRDFEAELLANEDSVQIYKNFMAARSDGEKAFDLKRQIIEVVRASGEQKARDLINQNPWAANKRIKKSLLITLEKEIIFKQGKQNNLKTSSVNVKLKDGVHPNALCTLSPSAEWGIYIDETGSIFDEGELFQTDQYKIGKMVALAIPQNESLEPLPEFHSTDRPSSEVDQVLQRILDARVGVLGFSVREPSARHRYWIGHVLHLIRWVLLELPIPLNNKECSVNFWVEQRGRFDLSTDFDVITEAIESELGAIDPGRYKNLRLRIKIMDKKHSLNGYVDALAYTWGSASKASKDRLKKSNLMGNCFVDLSEHSLHHLYIAITRDDTLAPHEWYTLCSAAANLSRDSFLPRSLESLGVGLKRDPHRWYAYINEVKQRMHDKKYHLSELGHAISWLQRFASDEQTLPGVLKLKLASSQLALANHQGFVDVGVISQCLVLVKDLHDEAPETASEAILRIASSLNNNYEFDALSNVIDDWLQKPAAIPGLLNHGKLQSARAQVHAFTGDPKTGVQLFAKAIETFENLSDQSIVAREKRQTGIYKLIAQMDFVFSMQQSELSAKMLQGFISDLVHFFGNKAPRAISQQIACSGQELRFEHHLWIRALIYFPLELEDARTEYVSRHGSWKQGSDHPWQLIQFYRSLLKFDSNLTEEAVLDFKSALELCKIPERGITLRWMALVFSAVGSNFNFLKHNKTEWDFEIAELRGRLSKAPFDALSKLVVRSRAGKISDHDVLKHLRNCLPFNFH